MIDHVEEFRPELQLLAFLDAEVLEQRRIDVHLARRGDGVAASVAKSSKGRIGKGSLVNPVGGTLMLGNNRDPRNYIGTRVASAAVAQAAPADGPRRPCIERLDALQLPAAYEKISQAAHSAPEFLSFAEGNVVTQAVHESMPDVEIGSIREQLELRRSLRQR